MRTLLMRSWLPAKGSAQRALRGKLLLLVAALFLVALLGLAACGAYSTGITGPQPTPVRTATGTAAPTAYAYLFSRIDYPLQVPVNAADLVTLTLSPNSNILTVTP